jgi:hypothetical protein
MGALFKNSGILDMVSNIVNPANQQSSQPNGITSIPVSNQNPKINMTGGRFNQIRDPRLNRVMSRPLFNMLQKRPDVDQLGRRYDDPRYYAMGGRVNYQTGGQTKTPPKFIPMDLESVAFRLFKDNLDNLTYNQKQTVYDYIEQNRNKKANGGRIGYADGSDPIPLGLVDYRNTPWENSMTKLGGTLSQVSQPVERKMGLMFNPDGSYPGENMPNPIQALPRPGQLSSQQESIKEAIMSLPQTRSNPQMNAMRRYSQVRDPRMMRLMQIKKQWVVL